MNHIELEVASRTDAGRVRPFNEDSVAVDASAGIAVLADGMAERRGAEIASRLATTQLLAKLKANSGEMPERAVREAFSTANDAICEHSKKDPTTRGMGTTLVAAWFRGDRVSIAHVGDSRLYRFREGVLERLTIDHSFVQEALSAGNLTDNEARLSQSRHLVTRALGGVDAVAPDLAEHEVKGEDIYLLCSDGLHDLVEDSDIALALEVLQPNLNLAALTLVEMANDRGGLDNVSVALVKVKSRKRETPKVQQQPGKKKAGGGGLFGWLQKGK
ncbi:MAG TPA: protein phosphatase 2C domain-containing protein [Burkholderiales bacterium]|nr:protein phosphatase 2C domain-containing protein [Burkholderiales bacterium]